MPWPSGPANIVVGIERDPFVAVFFAEKLHTVVADEDG